MTRSKVPARRITINSMICDNFKSQSSATWASRRRRRRRNVARRASRWSGNTAAREKEEARSTPGNPSMIIWLAKLILIHHAISHSHRIRPLWIGTLYANVARGRNERERVLRDARLITTRSWTSDPKDRALLHHSLSHETLWWK